MEGAAIEGIKREPLLDGSRGARPLPRPRAVRGSRYRHGRATIAQNAILVSGSGILEFDTECDWLGAFRMLRADFFPVFYSARVTRDVQFGNCERSTMDETSIVRAQFGICAQRSLSSGFAKNRAALRRPRFPSASLLGTPQLEP
jgi:hypothetical protein